MRRSSLPFVLALAIVAAFLVGVSANSASASSTKKGTDRSGVFYIDPDTAVDGDKVTLSANFATSQKGKSVTFYKGDSDADGATFSSIGKSIKANASGNAYLKSYVLSGNQFLFAKTSGDKETQLFTFMADGTSTGCSVAGTLSASPAMVAPHSTATFFANFLTDQAGATVTFSSVAADDTETPLGTATADITGNAYFDYQVGDADIPLKVRAATSNNKCTKSVTITPKVFIPPTVTVTGVSKSSATAVIDFGLSAADASVTLQYSADKAKWSTQGKKTTLGSAGTKTVTITSLPAYGRYYRATAKVDGVTQTTDPVYFSPMPDSYSNGLPVVRLSTQGGAKIDSETTYRNLNFTIDNGDPTHPVNSSSNVYTDVIKGRGNYSWKFPKKGYKIKLDKKTDLLGMGKSKHWVLVSNFIDKTLLRNATTQEISHRVYGDTGWTPKYKNVDLFLNGTYEGTYQLTEHVRIDDNRVDIKSLDETIGAGSPDITGGYLMEWNSRKAPPYFKTPDGSYISVDDPAPDADDPTEHDYLVSQALKDQMAYITKYVGDCETNVIDKVTASTTLDTLGTCINVDSLVNWWMVNELVKNTNGELYHSSFMYKDRGGVLTFGPPWDFDFSMGDGDRPGSPDTPTGWYLRDPNDAKRQVDVTWINHVFKSTAFQNRVKERWAEVYPGANGINAAAMTSWVDSQKALIQASETANNKIWPESKKWGSIQILHGGTFDKEVTFMKTWLTTRTNWMNGQLTGP